MHHNLKSAKRSVENTNNARKCCNYVQIDS